MSCIFSTFYPSSREINQKQVDRYKTRQINKYNLSLNRQNIQQHLAICFQGFVLGEGFDPLLTNYTQSHFVTIFPQVMKGGAQGTTERVRKSSHFQMRPEYLENVTQDLTSGICFSFLLLQVNYHKYGLEFHLALLS